MNADDQDRLLKEFLAGDECAGVRRASLDQGLALMRRRRRARRVGVLCLLTAVLGAAGFLSLSSSRPGARPAQFVRTNASRVPSPAAKASSVQIIDDDQLLALFPGRPVALVGRPGHQQLLFLDELPAEAERSEPGPTEPEPYQ